MVACAERNRAVILLAEDNLSDQILTQEAFKALNVPHELHIVSDGKEALDYLYRQGNYSSENDAPRPDMVLLDLNMPRVNGQQVAERIHADPALCRIPIVVLTISRRTEDVLKAYGRGVLCYISKPLDFTQFVAAVQELGQLIRFTRATKNLAGQGRISDRQMTRLARRRRLLERYAEAVFERQLDQIERSLRDQGRPPETVSEAGPHAPTAGSDARRETLGTMVEHSREIAETSGALCRLAEALQSSSSRDGVEKP